VVAVTCMAIYNRHAQVEFSSKPKGIPFAWEFWWTLALSCILVAIQGDKKMSVLLCVLIAELMVIATVIVVRASVS
jgi:hypothetical protein